MSHKDHPVLERIKHQGLLPLFYHPDPLVCSAVMGALYTAGIRVIEFTNRGEHALQNFSNLRKLKEKEMPDLILGIGTIKSGQQALQFLAEGAGFLVSPGWVPDVMDVAVRHAHLYVPGAMTPTEIISAEHGGATFVKLFPGNLLGPSFMTAIRDLFPQIDFMPTGGAEPERSNLEAWFRAGVAGVGMGSKLITPEILEHKAYAKLTDVTKNVLEMIREIRQL
jgi:2-dehydro-3-deoxyphosphogluconate aldolase / (4S)-4-hydroxy-2-oxoglutarate aldolase